MIAPVIRCFALRLSLTARDLLLSGGRRGASGVLLLGVTSWLATTSCVDRSVDPPPPLGPIAELQISASVAGTPVSTLIVTVSAPDIQPELIFNIQAVNGTAIGNIALPVGANRLVLVRAVDASGITTHEGSKQVVIREGSNPPVSIPLLPLVGNQPIDVRIGNRAIRISPGAYLLRPGQTVVLSAVVTDLNDNPIPVNADEIRWASMNTRLATVDQQGRVTGESFGDVQIIASYGGAAGAARVAVAPVGETILAAGDIGECTSLPTLPPAPPAQPSAGAIATAQMLDTLPGLVLALGDLAYPKGRARDYAQCYEPTWGRHKTRTRPVPGNHEYEAPTDTAYFDYWQGILAPFGAAAIDRTKGWYSFDLGSWHIIALNSEVPRGATSPQMAWLRADLAATTAPCVLAFWHQPLFNSGSHHGPQPNVRPLWDTLYAYNADVILSAHEHLYERFAPQTPVAVPDPARGIRQFTSGAGGTVDLYNFAAVMRPNSEFGLAGKYGVLEMVLGDNKYGWRYITAPDGVVRDAGTGTCH
jgi:hypothetical protein